MNSTELKNGYQLNGIVLFHSAYCKVCQKQIAIFQTNNIKFTSMECDDDPDYFIKTFDLDITPETRIYENGNVVWKKTDFISEEDFKFLKDYNV